MSLVHINTVKEYLKITVDDVTQDALIQAMINSAENIVENYLGTVFTITEYTEIKGGGFRYFQMAKGPIVTVEEVYHVDQEYTYESDEYIIVDSKIYVADNGVVAATRWPAGNYQITYTAGYTYSGSVNNVPDGIELAALLIVSRFWDNRGGLLSQNSGVAGSQSWNAVIAPGSDVWFILQPYVQAPMTGV